MKIKDILNSGWSIRTRIMIARRLLKCSNLMKQEIANWKRTGIIPNRSLTFDVDGVEMATISVEDLVNTYGMEPLTAMLFFDDLIKANLNADKTRLINLIQTLTNGVKQKSLSLTPSMLADIKAEQPELWAEYERQKAAAEISDSETEAAELEEIEIAE